MNTIYDKNEGLSFSTYGNLVEDSQQAAQLLVEVARVVKDTESDFRSVEEVYEKAKQAYLYQLSQLNNAYNHAVRKGFLPQHKVLVKTEEGLYSFTRDDYDSAGQVEFEIMQITHEIK